MRRLLILALVLASAAAAYAVTFQAEVLVQTTPTKMNRLAGISTAQSFGYEVQNLGPNDIYCAIGYANPQDAGPTVYDDGGLVDQVGMARDVSASGGTWAGRVPGQAHLFCVAKTANQVSGAATILTEVP